MQIDVETDGDSHVVTARTGGRTFRYRVHVGDAELTGFGAEGNAIAGATIAFLLDREPATSIMAEFDTAVVSRYFPEYPSELPGYL